MTRAEQCRSFRDRIMDYLMYGPTTAGDLVVEFGENIQTIYRHLRWLLARGLVVQDGRFWTLARTR